MSTDLRKIKKNRAKKYYTFMKYYAKFMLIFCIIILISLFMIKNTEWLSILKKISFAVLFLTTIFFLYNYQTIIEGRYLEESMLDEEDALTHKSSLINIKYRVILALLSYINLFIALLLIRTNILINEFSFQLTAFFVTFFLLAAISITFKK